MALSFYMDVHVPGAITAGLRRRGLNALTSQEDGTRTLNDESLLARASELGRLHFTQDKDLLRIARAWQAAGEPFPGVVFAPQLQVSIGELIDDLELIATCGSADEFANQVVFLPWS